MNQPNTMLISEASLRKKLEISRATIYRAIRYDLAAVEAFIAKLSEGENT